MFAFGGIGHGDDTSFGLADIPNSQRLGTINHAETIRKVDELQEITVNGSREDRPHNSLKNGNQ